jgi:hypothetical protein
MKLGVWWQVLLKVSVEPAPEGKCHVRLKASGTYTVHLHLKACVARSPERQMWLVHPKVSCKCTLQMHLKTNDT